MPGSERKKWFALALILTVQFMTILDIAIVNVALPSIQVDLGFAQENLQWVISAYALVFGGFLLLGGRSADLLGRRRVFMAGTFIFTLGSLLCGLAWSEESLIAFRALQGLGAATLTPAALSILVAMFAEGRERNIALGAWGAVGGVGAAAGVLFGGVLVDFLSWEWIFFVNVPVGVAALILAPFLLAESLDKHGQGFDIPGAVLVTSGLSLLVLGITQGYGWGWGSGKTIGVFVAAAAAPPRVRRVGEACEGSARPVLDLPAADADGRERRRLRPRDGALLDVPDPHAVHAAGARPERRSRRASATWPSPARRSSGRTSPRRR